MKKAALLLSACLLAACQPQPATEGPLSDREKNLLHLAQTMETGGDANAAIELYKRAMAKSQHRVEAHIGLAKLYIKLDQTEEAVAVLEAAKNRQPNDVTLNHELAKRMIDLGDVQKAIQSFDAGLQTSPHHLELLSGKGVALDMLGNHKEAQSHYFLALEHNRKGTEFVQNNLAMSYIMDGSYDKAIRLLKGLPKLEDTPVMRQNLALAYGLKGDMANASLWGLKDLTQEELEENIAFYQSYTGKLNERQRLE